MALAIWLGFWKFFGGVLLMGIGTAVSMIGLMCLFSAFGVPIKG